MPTVTTPPADPNGTIASAVVGPTLSGGAIEPVAGVVGTDGQTAVGPADVDGQMLLRVQLLSDDGAVLASSDKPPEKRFVVLTIRAL